MPRPNTLPASVRIRTAREFDRVFRDGLRASDGRVTLLGRSSGLAYARLGISVPRRYGNAVRRNRIKRLIREAFRTTRHDLPPADWIVIPRPGQSASVEQLRASLLGLTRRLAKRLDRATGATSPSASGPTQPPRATEPQT